VNKKIQLVKLTYSSGRAGGLLGDALKGLK
jgi:hypothetical protein